MLHRIGFACVLVSVAGVGLAYSQDTTTRVSVRTGGAQATGGGTLGVATSGDGRFVAFGSTATDLVPGDTNNAQDIFVHDRQAGTTERVNVGPNGAQTSTGFSSDPSISDDGRYVVFTSTSPNLVTDDTNARIDVFLRDRQAGTTIRVSAGLTGFESNGNSNTSVMSANGRYIAFRSLASNLVVSDTNGFADIFLFDRETSQTVRVNLAPSGVQATGGDSFAPSLSADGRVVAFFSLATNLVAGDTNGVSDVFVHDRQVGSTARLSVGPNGVGGNSSSIDPSVSGDGRFVTFTSAANNLEPGGGVGLFIHDRQTSVTSPLSVNNQTISPPSTHSRISADGAYICYTADPGGTFTQVVLIKRQTLAKTVISVATSGEGEGHSDRCVPNGDATVLAFLSDASNLIAGDTNTQPDTFVRTIPGNATSTLALDKVALTFAAVTSGGSFLSQTGAQTVRLTQRGKATVTWTAVSTQPWLHVSPASGTGSSTLSISVAPAAGLLQSGNVTGTIVMSLTGSLNTLPPIEVSLRLIPNGTAVGPFGVVDTPTDNRTGVTGAVPFTGWALDDIDVTRVSICRDASGAEVAPFDPNCGGAAGIFVGFAVFIDGARPDVAASVPTHPLATRAGWGFMVLTNFLPNQGNGTFRFTMRAQDREGNWVVLGTRTMTCANASATLPFGTLDTPEQGGIASGSAFPSFGWALTPLPKTIPINGATIHVLVDGVDVGTADYNHARPDIQALFPGFNNTNGAVGFRILDTTALSNGLHTISWAVTDDQGAIEGLGSRFFTVSNGVGAVTAVATSTSRRDVETLPLETTPVAGRRGWDLQASYGWFGAGATGVTVIRSEEVNRVELQLGPGNQTGYLRTPAGLAPLPIGSRLDPATNTFTWAPGVGFVGRYDFVFVRSTDGVAVARRDVRVILQPKGRGAVGPQVVIDTPRAHAAVREPFMVGGWAVDLDAADGTGVTTLHGWAFPAAGGAPIFLGATAYGGSRPDVAAVHGQQFKDSGFGLIAQGLIPGDYDLALFAWSTETMGFVAPRTVRVGVRP